MSKKAKPAPFVPPPRAPRTPAEEMRATWIVHLIQQQTARRQLRNAIEQVKAALDEVTDRCVVRGQANRCGQSGVFGISVPEVEHLVARLSALAEGRKALEAVAQSFDVSLTLSEEEKALYEPLPPC